jgi:NADPH-dependent 2,4-dienoyl-CoA reductase/sulfur reductase-like enzyme
MSESARHSFELLVVGGGPAGIAAAVRAAECGLRVAVVDDNPAPGGQIWRGQPPDDTASKWLERLARCGARQLCGLRVVAQPEPGVLLAEGFHDACELRFEQLILATGARERFLPFPGWTLPNVMGAGGLQAMVKSGLAVRGKRVVVAGTGPLLPAVAAYLASHGARVAAVCDQAPLNALVRFGLTLARHPGKLAQAVRLKRQLARVPLYAGSWVTRAHGQNTLEAVALARPGRLDTIACDYLACGFHLVPNVELPWLLGCGVAHGFVTVDEFQRTNVAGVFCAGEPTGIGGVELSLIEGEIAGFAAAGREAEARNLFARRRGARRFAAALDAVCELRPELKSLPDAQTIVCRCEDVTFERLRGYTSAREAKLQTRCGMGACQGRSCVPAAQFLFGWNPEPARPPVFPALVQTLTRPAGDAGALIRPKSGETQ